MIMYDGNKHNTSINRMLPLTTILFASPILSFPVTNVVPISPSFPTCPNLMVFFMDFQIGMHKEAS